MRSFDLSTAVDFTAEGPVLRELQARADRCQVQLLVVGARARDLLIRGVVGAEPTRATADEDLLERHDFDVRLAGADRLGYEALSMLGGEGASQMVDLVVGECSSTGRLPAQMGGRVQLSRELLVALLAGMRRSHQERR